MRLPSGSRRWPNWMPRQRNIDLELRVFGSLAWQALSGLQYLTPQSDIDLLWHPLSNAQLQQGIALLARWEQDHGLRADGEVLFGGEQRGVLARMGYIEVRQRSARIGEARIQRGTGSCTRTAGAAGMNQLLHQNSRCR